MEQATIHAALTGNDQHGVVLIGSAGVGKTTLARTVAGKLPSAVHWAACTESSQTIPLGAFMQWVGSSGARDPVALLAAARERCAAVSAPPRREGCAGVSCRCWLPEISTLRPIAFA